MYMYLKITKIIHRIDAICDMISAESYKLLRLSISISCSGIESSWQQLWRLTDDMIDQIDEITMTITNESMIKLICKWRNCREGFDYDDDEWMVLINKCDRKCQVTKIEVPLLLKLDIYHMENLLNVMINMVCWFIWLIYSRDLFFCSLE